VYEVHVTDEFQEWLDGLRDRRAQARIALRLSFVEAGTLGDWRPVGHCVSEMRVDVGAGYRLYFMRRERIIIVMLGGGDKSTQSRDIAFAQRLAAEWDLRK
jgi:putative addiction module killer protein